MSEQSESINGIMNRGRNSGFRQANNFERPGSGRLSNVPEDNNSKVDNELGSSFIENVPN